MKLPTAVQVHVLIAVVIICAGIWYILSLIAYVMAVLVEAVGFGV